MTIDQLKREVGQIKVTKLSYKKVQLEYQLKIRSKGLTIGYLPMKVRYKIDGDMFPIKDVIFNKLSMKYAIKKKHIGIMIERVSDIIHVDDIIFQPKGVPTYISFDDDIWHRDRILCDLLAQ